MVGEAAFFRSMNRMFPRIGTAVKKQLTAVIEREGAGFVSLCPELDIASQGASIEGARENLREAVELIFETASPSEIETPPSIVRSATHSQFQTRNVRVPLL
jgi:predicted RNase H-like HicB family nuclease